MSDQPLGARAPLGLRQLHQLERILDIVDRAQPGKQRFAIVLEYVAELDVAQRLAVEQNFAGIGRNEPGDHVDQRALAAAVRPEHRDELAAWDVEVEPVVDDGVAEALGQAADGDVSRSGGFGGAPLALVGRAIAYARRRQVARSWRSILDCRSGPSDAYLPSPREPEFSDTRRGAPRGRPATTPRRGRPQGSPHYRLPACGSHAGRKGGHRPHQHEIKTPADIW